MAIAIGVRVAVGVLISLRTYLVSLRIVAPFWLVLVVGCVVCCCLDGWRDGEHGAGGDATRDGRTGTDTDTGTGTGSGGRPADNRFATDNVSWTREGIRGLGTTRVHETINLATGIHLKRGGKRERERGVNNEAVRWPVHICCWLNGLFRYLRTSLSTSSSSARSPPPVMLLCAPG